MQATSGARARFVLRRGSKPRLFFIKRPMRRHRRRSSIFSKRALKSPSSIMSARALDARPRTRLTSWHARRRGRVDSGQQRETASGRAPNHDTHGRRRRRRQMATCPATGNERCAREQTERALINEATHSGSTAIAIFNTQFEQSFCRFAEGSAFSRWSNGAFDVASAIDGAGSSASKTRDLFSSGEQTSH